ncbi:hypothetical protein TMatcc_005406 [Talaromyces marneffei ATCC 18224]
MESHYRSPRASAHQRHQSLLSRVIGHLRQSSQYIDYTVVDQSPTALTERDEGAQIDYKDAILSIQDA